MSAIAKRFNLQTLAGEVVFRDIGIDHMYLSGYGVLVTGYPRVDALEIDAVSRLEFALCGQKRTTYIVVRTA